jgi:hypothetical protein
MTTKGQPRLTCFVLLASVCCFTLAEGALRTSAYTARAALPGFFIRHVKGIEVSDVEVSYMKEDLRPSFVLNDVKDADFF